MSNESLSIETIQALILALCWLLNSRLWRANYRCAEPKLNIILPSDGIFYLT